MDRRGLEYPNSCNWRALVTPPLLELSRRDRVVRGTSETRRPEPQTADQPLGEWATWQSEVCFGPLFKFLEVAFGTTISEVNTSFGLLGAHPRQASLGGRGPDLVSVCLPAIEGEKSHVSEGKVPGAKLPSSVVELLSKEDWPFAFQIRLETWTMMQDIPWIVAFPMSTGFQPPGGGKTRPTVGPPQKTRGTTQRAQVWEIGSCWWPSRIGRNPPGGQPGRFGFPLKKVQRGCPTLPLSPTPDWLEVNVWIASEIYQKEWNANTTMSEYSIYYLMAM